MEYRPRYTTAYVTRFLDEHRRATGETLELHDLYTRFRAGDYGLLSADEIAANEEARKPYTPENRQPVMQSGDAPRPLNRHYQSPRLSDVPHIKARYPLATGDILLILFPLSGETLCCWEGEIGTETYINRILLEQYACTQLPPYRLCLELA